MSWDFFFCLFDAVRQEVTTQADYDRAMPNKNSGEACVDYNRSTLPENEQCTGCTIHQIAPTGKK